MQEQALINEFHRRISKKESILDLIPVIEREYSSSVILNYYLGYYHEQNKAFNEAEERYLHCIHICPSFANSYLNLGAYYFSVLREREAEGVLSAIFNKKTLDTSVAARTLTYDFPTQLRICSLLGPYYIRIKERKKAIHVYSTIHSKIQECKQMNYTLVEGWKNLCMGLGGLFNKIDPERAYQYFLGGIHKYNIQISEPIYRDMLLNLDRQLVQGAILVKNYCMEPQNPQIDFNQLYPSSSSVQLVQLSHEKIRIGYLTPDLNKNAVGLFSTVLLKHFNREKFEVYVYYTNDKKDEFTALFMSYPNIHWFDVHEFPTDKLYKFIHDEHEIDILVDMIAMGVGGKPELISMKPAKMIVNYLGFPDTGYLPQYTHRITDRICDPGVKGGYTEKLIYMPRTFICYKLFENVPTPEIRYVPAKRRLNIGIFNKVDKQHPFIRKIWKTILSKRKNAVLFIKGEIDKELYADFPQDQLKSLPFTETLPEYFEQMNAMDVCFDTHPYSGTTTTASCLFMGLPVITLYKPTNHHVSNVSASFLTQVGDQDLICSSITEYVNKAVNFSLETPEKRLSRRTRFLELMDGHRYMKEYEQLLLEEFTNMV
jgi:predicted O-linked N-acetylglucosamine transferase (SPINDLY family)